MTNLPLTGERLHPEYQWGDRNFCEHYARYFLAAQLVRTGDRVLDIASGEGYGSQLLYAGAKDVAVVGVDNDIQAVRHASAKYLEPAYELGDITALPDAWNQKFNLVVSFETIEHVSDPALAIKELRRVLRDDGYLVISTPNRGVYAAGNPYHLHELSATEFSRLLAPHFPWIELYRQDWRAGSFLWPAGTRKRNVQPLVYGPMLDPGDAEEYVVAVCGPGEWRQTPIVVT